MKTLQIRLWCMICCCSIGSIAAIYCPASLNTVVNVRRCPRTILEWKNASVYKNCTNEIQSCVRQTNFVYHCVINTYLNATVEVCAPSSNILGHTCAEYNMEGARIQGHVDTVCRSCPFRYPSTDAYKFQSCYTLIKRVELPTTTEKILSTLPSLQNTTLPSLQNTTFTMKPVKSKANTVVIITTIVVGIVIVIAAVVCVVCCFRKIKYQRTLTDQEGRSSELSPLKSEEKVIVALEIGQHFSGFGYSTKQDDIPRIPVDCSGKPKKIPSVVWYNCKTKEVKIGYDALDEFMKCDGNPPECISYSGDLTIDYKHVESCMQKYSRFLLGLLNAVLQFIGKEHKSPNKADIYFVIIIKRSGVNSEEISKSVKEYVSSGITEAGVRENQIQFLMESECVRQYVQFKKSTSVYFNGLSPTDFRRKDKFMILKTGHAGIQYDILEINKEEEKFISKHHAEFFSDWHDKKSEDKLLQMFADQFKNISLPDLKRDYKAFYCELSMNLHKLKENSEEMKYTEIGLPEKLRTVLPQKVGSVLQAKGILVSQNKLKIGSEVIKGFMEDICKNTRTVIQATCTEDRLKEVRFVCLIGGYAYNERIQTIVREHFQRISKKISVHVPEEPGFAAIKGAMLDTV